MLPLWQGDEGAIQLTRAVAREMTKQGFRNGTESRGLLPLR